MDQLRSRVTTAITALFGFLIVVDVFDDLFLGNRWEGCPRELFGLMGAILAGLYASQALRRGGGDGKQNGTKEVPG